MDLAAPFGRDGPAKAAPRGLPRRALAALLVVMVWGALTLDKNLTRIPFDVVAQAEDGGDLAGQDPTDAAAAPTAAAAWPAEASSPAEDDGVDCEQPESLVQEAECGHDFQAYYNGSKARDPAGLRIAFYGHMHGSTALPLQRFSGCPVNHGKGTPGCLQDPSCSMFRVPRGGDLRKADVVVVDRTDAERLTTSRLWDKEIPRYREPQGPAPGRRRYRVIYVREAGYVSEAAQAEADFVMGVHYWNALLNPNFFVRPMTFVNRNQRVARAVASKGRPSFAISVTSNCEPTASRRGVYMDALQKALGTRVRVDRYGTCGRGFRRAPPKPLANMADLAAEYKFYLAFENTIMDGYVSEKLLQSLTFGPVPVYLGAPDVFNITRLPSFINVHDFGSPSELADYLVYLAGNETAYDAYHAWRDLPVNDMFTDDYLARVSRHVPGRSAYRAIQEAYRKAAPDRKVNPTRVANCCTLCNPALLEELSKPALSRRFIERKPWSVSQIQRQLFD